MFKAGDRVTVHIPQDNREWGYNPCADGDVATVQTDQQPNDTWIAIEQNGAIRSEYMTRLRPIKRLEFTSAHPGRLSSAFVTHSMIGRGFEHVGRIQVRDRNSDDIYNNVVANELEHLARWVRDTGNYDRDDASDEIARAIENRIRTLRGHVTLREGDERPAYGWVSRALLQKAVAQERERCAKIAEMSAPVCGNCNYGWLACECHDCREGRTRSRCCHAEKKFTSTSEGARIARKIRELV